MDGIKVKDVLEDQLRDSEGFNDFLIHDTFTGNITTPYRGEK